MDNAGQTKKVLLVDDEPELLEMVKMRLEANNFEVITASDGQDALGIVRRVRPDIVILDIMLPKLDGFKVCRMFKFDDKYKSIPVILLTARVRETDRKTASEVGADAFITKPFEPQALLSNIYRLLGMEASGDQGNG
ncbi:MAG: response regulator [Candidatus Omnitrophota bacterium]|jgi:DNA-binding response OmpR family regulator